MIITASLKRGFVGTLATWVLLLGRPEAAEACNPTSMASDRAVQAWQPNGCWPDFFRWSWRAYDIGYADDSWQPWGYFDACNTSRPFAKTTASTLVLTYALEHASNGWHTGEEYMNSALARASRFHGNYTTRFIMYGSRPSAGATRSGNQVDHHCPMHQGSDVGASGNSVAFRAAALVHEANHMWRDGRGFSPHHSTGPQRACTASGASCDTFMWHTISEGRGLLDAAIYRYNGTYIVHTAYQSEAEYACDLHTDARGDTPRSVTDNAREIANSRYANNFLNKVPFRCGDPRPF